MRLRHVDWKLLLILAAAGTFDRCDGTETIDYGGAGDGGGGTETTTSTSTTADAGSGGATGGAGGAVTGGGGTGGVSGGEVGTLCVADGDCSPGLTCEQANPDNQGAVPMCTRSCLTDGTGNPVPGSCNDPGLSCLGAYQGGGAICYATCAMADDCPAEFDCVGPFVSTGDRVCMPLPK